MNISSLELQVQTYLWLTKHGIYSIRDLTKHTELQLSKLKGANRDKVNDVCTQVEEKGYHLGTRFDRSGDPISK